MILFGIVKAANPVQFINPQILVTVLPYIREKLLDIANGACIPFMFLPMYSSFIEAVENGEYILLIFPNVKSSVPSSNLS